MKKDIKENINSEFKKYDYTNPDFYMKNGKNI